MLKLTKTGIGLLTRQYRSVLRKCFLINIGVFALGAAAVMTPNEAMADSTTDKWYIKSGKDAESTTVTASYDGQSDSNSQYTAVVYGSSYYSSSSSDINSWSSKFVTGSAIYNYIQNNLPDTSTFATTSWVSSNYYTKDTADGKYAILNAGTYNSPQVFTGYSKFNNVLAIGDQGYVRSEGATFGSPGSGYIGLTASGGDGVFEAQASGGMYAQLMASSSTAKVALGQNYNETVLTNKSFKLNGSGNADGIAFKDDFGSPSIGNSALATTGYISGMLNARDFVNSYQAGLNGTDGWAGSTLFEIMNNVGYRFYEIGQNYYNKTDADGRYVNVTGDTMSGGLSIVSSSASDATLHLGTPGDNLAYADLQIDKLTLHTNAGSATVDMYNGFSQSSMAGSVELSVSNGLKLKNSGFATGIDFSGDTGDDAHLATVGWVKNQNNLTYYYTKDESMR